MVFFNSVTSDVKRNAANTVAIVLIVFFTIMAISFTVSVVDKVV